MSALPAAQKTMAKKMQQGTGEERIVAKSKPTLHLVSKTEASSSTAESKCIQPSGDARSTQLERFDSSAEYEETRSGDSNQNDAASSSQVWQKDAERDESTRRLVATGTNQDLLNFRETS